MKVYWPSPLEGGLVQVNAIFIVLPLRDCWVVLQSPCCAGISLRSAISCVRHIFMAHAASGRGGRHLRALLGHHLLHLLALGGRHGGHLLLHLRHLRVHLAVAAVHLVGDFPQAWLERLRPGGGCESHQRGGKDVMRFHGFPCCEKNLILRRAGAAAASALSPRSGQRGLAHRMLPARHEFGRARWAPSVGMKRRSAFHSAESSSVLL